MKRENLHKHWELIKAYKEGAEIQFYSEIYVMWMDTKNPEWEFNTKYRIKPEPKLVPFTLADAEYLVGRVVKRKYDNFISILSACMITECCTSHEWVTYQELMDKYTFLDGSPCGKIVQEDEDK